MNTKKELRSIYRQKRNEITTSDRLEWEQKQCEQLQKLSIYREADVILVYVSFGSEAGTAKIIETALADDKEVYVPRVTGKRSMDFYRIGCNGEEWTVDCEPGAYGILEPKEDLKRYEYEAGKQTLMILPGLSFDKKGNRLGYGAAYYDTYLAKLHGLSEFTAASFHTCGLCYQLQVSDELPAEPHDFKLGQIVTEEGFLL